MEVGVGTGVGEEFVAFVRFVSRGAVIVVYPVCPVMAVVSPLVSTENVTAVPAVGFDPKLLHSMVSCLPTVGSWVPSMVTIRFFCVPVIAADVTVTAALAPVSVEVVVIVQVVVVDVLVLQMG